MNFKEKTVIHKQFGPGKIYDIDDSYISIMFSDRLRKFLFPGAFNSLILTTEDKDLKQSISICSTIKEETSVNVIKESVNKEHTSIVHPHKHSNRTNVAFKCNFCDGGSSDEKVGFSGVCSYDNLIWNINEVKHTWCRNEKCACQRFLNGNLSEIDLIEGNNIGTKSGFVCYESRMLIDWKASAGIHHKGRLKDVPMKLKNVDKYSLCILTTREQFQEEKDRYIFGIFLIDKVFEGDLEHTGYVTTSSKYKIILSPSETKQLSFWKYHSNENNSKVPQWKSGLHRYLQNDVSASILRDVVNIKKGTKDELLSREFLEYFCNINSMDISDIKQPNGALII